MAIKIIKTESGVIYSLDSLNKTLEYNGKTYKVNFAVGLTNEIMRQPLSMKQLHHQGTSVLHSETELNSSIQPGSRVYFDCGSNIFLSSIVASVYSSEDFTQFDEVK